MGRLILHLPTGPMKISMVVMVIILIILTKTCSTQSAPASSWVTPSQEEDASSPSKFVFLSSGFVEMFSLCQKKVTSEEFLLSCPPFPFSFSGSSRFSFLRASSFCLGYHDTRIFIVHVQYVQNCNLTNLLR